MTNSKTHKNRQFLFYYALVAMVLGVALLSGCANPISPNASLKSDTGSLTISIPSVATWLQAYEPNTTGKRTASRNASRALACSSSVKVEITDANGNTIFGPDVISLWDDFENLGSNVPKNINYIPAGTGYTIKVSVYNAWGSYTDPVVSGQTTGVTISAGQNTAVSIHCLPVNPSPITVNGGTIMTSIYYSAEKWYSLSVENGTHYYFTETDSGVVMGLFNGEGTFIATNAGYIDYLATYSGTAYLVAAGQYGSEHTATLTVCTTAPVLNEGSISSPFSLSLNTAHTFKAGPSASSQNTCYYSFTTDSAGSYALSTGHGWFNITLYSNSGFSMVVSDPDSVAYGEIFTGLSAATTYYMKLENSDPDLMLLSGQLVDPVTIGANSEAEGSVTTPINLVPGSTWAGKVGHYVYNEFSYYKFTTGTVIDYRITLSDISPYGNLIMLYAFSDAAFTSYVAGFGTSSSATRDLVLSPLTTYYLRTYNESMDAALSYNLNISSYAPSFFALPVSAIWTIGTQTTSGRSVWYEASVTGGQTYTLNWDDKDQGSGTYSSDIWVTAYREDRSTSYFVTADSGYTTGQTITVPSGQTKLYIRVEGYYSGDTGTFALKLQ